MRIIRSLAIIAWCMALASVCAAAEWPTKAIRIVVPYAAGSSSSDLLARVLEQRLGMAFGQPVILDYRPGGGGTVAAKWASHSPPDGYTLYFGNNGPNAIGPQVLKDVGYDPEKDFAPVSLIAVVPLILTANPSIPANDMKGFIAYAKANAGRVEYGTPGVGSFAHLATELMAKEAGIQLVHVPFKSSGESTLALLRGDVKIQLGSSTDALLSNIKAGKLKLLGVTAASATPLAPGAKPIADAIPGFAMEGWFALFAPAGTPGEIIDRLNAATRQALALPEVQKQFLGWGLAAKTSAPAELAKLNHEEVMKWRKVAQDLNLESK